MNINIIWPIIGDYVIVAAMGAVVSSGEIISRYRDDPWDALRSLPAIFYMLINALVSIGALEIVRTFGMNFGASETNTPLIQVVVAGLGAMMIFRSAFFNIQVGDQDIAVGAAGFLQVMLSAVDGEVDRRRAILRAERVKRIMENVDFNKAIKSLPEYSISLMQSIEERDKKELLTAADPNRYRNIDDNAVNAQILGLAVMNVLGERVLRSSVDALREQIELPPKMRPSTETDSRGLMGKVGGMVKEFISEKTASEKTTSDEVANDGQPAQATQKPASQSQSKPAPVSNGKVEPAAETTPVTASAPAQNPGNAGQ